MSNSNDNVKPPAIQNSNDEDRDSTTMLLANVSEQYGSSIPSTRFARQDGGRSSDGSTEKKESATVNNDTGATKHLHLPLFLSSKFRSDEEEEAYFLWYSVLFTVNIIWLTTTYLFFFFSFYNKILLRT